MSAQRDARRCVVLTLPLDRVLAALQGAGALDGLPGDAELRGVACGASGAVLGLLVWSRQFAPAAEGEPWPVRPAVLRWRGVAA